MDNDTDSIVRFENAFWQKKINIFTVFLEGRILLVFLSY